MGSKQNRLHLMLTTMTGETIQYPAEPLRRAQKCAATDESRLYLTGLLLTKDGMIYASNGHVMYEDDLGIDLDAPMLIRLHAPIPKPAKRLTLHFLTESKGHAHCEGKEGTPEKILAFDLLPMGEQFDPSLILDVLACPSLATGHVTISSELVALVQDVYPGEATWTFRGTEAPIEIRSGVEDDGSRMVVMPMKEA